MKLYLILISALLPLVPLVSASPVTSPVTTILYTNNGTNDFLLMNGNNLHFLTYTYEENDLSFLIESSTTSDEARLRLRSDLLKKEKTSLVIEEHPGVEGQSSESLKHLIRFIGRQIILREPNEEERKRLEDYKKKQTRKSNFKVVRQPTKFSTETSGLAHFDVSYYQTSGETQHSFNVEAVFDDNHSKSLELSSIKLKADKQTIENASFVIERQPGRKDADCENDEAAGLKPWRCRGEMAFKNLH